MLEEAIARLHIAQEACAETRLATEALVAALEEAILSADFAAERNRSAADISRVAYNMRGGMVGGGDSVSAAHEQIRQAFRDVRSLLGSARANAEKVITLTQGQINDTAQFINRLQG